MKKVYLAGPTIFFRNAADVFKEYVDICARFDMEGIPPVDGDNKSAEEIFRGNVNLIENSQAVIADVSPFRGVHMDPGTAWELGCSVGLGIPVICFTRDIRNVADRTPYDGMLVELFGLKENLMIHFGSLGIFDNFVTAAYELSKRL